MANDLMNDIRLRRIIWVFCVSDILSGTEYFEGKRIEKLSLTENSMGWVDCESRFAFEIARQLIKLRNPL